MVPNYGDDIRISRPGRQPRRSPVIRLHGVNSYDPPTPGPSDYSPRRISEARAPGYSMSFRNPCGGLEPKPTPSKSGPGNVTYTSLGYQKKPGNHTAAAVGFPKADRLSQMSPRAFGPGPSDYSPRQDHKGKDSDILNKDSVRASRCRMLNTRVVAEQQNAINITPGPTDYSPRNATGTDGRFNLFNGPRHKIGKQPCGTGYPGVPPEATPGPQAYKIDGMNADRAGGHMGDAPCYSISNSKNPARVVSKKIPPPAGLESPGPAAYTPREQFNVVEYTNSNTSTHPALYSIGTERRRCVPDQGFIF